MSMEDDEAEVRGCQEEEEAILFPILGVINKQPRVGIRLTGWLGSGRDIMQYQQLPAILQMAF